MTIDPAEQSPFFGRLHGKKAWRQSLHLAAISCAKVESSLGPMGAYKLVHYNRGPEHVVKVTKDAVEVLKELEIQYPAVKAFAEAAKVHREEVGDGCSTFVIIIASLLEGAEALIKKKVHPNIILNGYLSAAREASRIFDEATLLQRITDDEVLEVADCGRGILTPNIRAEMREAALRAEKQGGIDQKTIRVLTKSGASVGDSKLIRGVVVRKSKVHPSMVSELNGAKVALVNKAFDIQRVELLMKGTGPFKIKLNITKQGQIQAFKAEEARMSNELVEALVSAGAQVVLCRAKITGAIADQMSRAGILAFSMVDQADIEAVAEATGATVVGDVMNLEAKDLGLARTVSMQKIENIDYVSVEAEKGSTLLLRGSSYEDTQELERVVKNAITLLQRIRTYPQAVWGGGATFMRIAIHLREYALTFPGKEQMAILAFADAMEQIPVTLIRNFGLSYSATLPQMRSYHARGMHSMGVAKGGCVSMDGESGVRDIAFANKMVISRAYDVARLLLRIDDYFYAKALPLYHKK